MQTAILQHALDTGHLYHQSCAIKNGLPESPPRQVIEDAKPASESPAATAVSSVVAPVKGALLKKALLLGATLFSGAGLGGLAATAAVALARPSAETDVGTTATAPAVPLDRDASLYQYLQDKGLHVPPEKRTRP